MEADTRVLQLTDSVDTGSKTEQHRCNANKAVISYTSANTEKSENHSDIILTLLIITSHINKWGLTFSCPHCIHLNILGKILNLHSFQAQRVKIAANFMNLRYVSGATSFFFFLDLIT